jgi:hypothetical protein
MPNHFHLLVKQLNDRSISGFINSICTRYSMYFNKKYDRVGSLFQGPFRAVLVNNDEYLLHLSRYIHRNPLELNKNLESAYSSYKCYIGKQKIPWLKPDFILSYFNKKLNPEFKKVQNYQDFVEKLKMDSQDILGKLTLD